MTSLACGWVPTAVSADVVPVNYYFAEGATGAFFDLDLLLGNPNARPASVELRYLRADGEVITQELLLEPWSRRTVVPENIPGLEAAEFATTVVSVDGLPLLVERSMFWDERRHGGHSGEAAKALSSIWYFAEGTQLGFDTYLLVANVDDEPVELTFEFLLQDGSPVTRHYEAAPKSRFTLYAGDVPELRGRSFSTVVRSSLPVVAERAMYFARAGGWDGGHVALGARAPAPRWMHSEGATGDYFDTFFLLGNPNAAPATVTVTYMVPSGEIFVRTHQLPPSSRVTINPEWEHSSLANTAVSTVIESDLPIVSERAMYWPGTPGSWRGGHCSLGVTEPRLAWGLAEGRTGEAEGFETYLLLANPTEREAQVDVLFLCESGPVVDSTWLMAPTSRLNVRAGAVLEGETCGRFSVVVQSMNDTPFFAERSLYWRVAGSTSWADGTNTAGIPIDRSIMGDALAQLARLRAGPAPPPHAAETSHIYAYQPTILRHRLVVADPVPLGQATLVVPLRREVHQGTEADFTVTVAVNDVVVSVVSSADLTDQWTMRLIAVPGAMLTPGVNTVTLRIAGVTWDAAVVVYASTDADGESCRSFDDGDTWDCAGPDPLLSGGRGFTYDIRLEFGPTEEAIAPQWRFLMDPSRYALVGYYQSYAWAHVGPYFLDPLNNSDLTDLASLDLRGHDDYETATNIFVFVHAALNYPRALDHTQDAHRVLFETQGAWCTGNAATFVALAALHGIDARMVGLVHDAAASGLERGHVVAEAWIDGKWVLFDPFALVSLEREDPDGRRSRYSVGEIAAARPAIEAALLSDLAVDPAIEQGLGDTFGELSMEIAADGQPVRYVDFFNTRAIVHAGPAVLPYYSTQHPPVDAQGDQ